MELGERVGLIYQRQRLEGENDLASILLAIGSELEGFDFSRAFVGPWNVANKAAELIMEACAGERGTLPEIVRKEGAKAWVKGTIEGRGKHEMHAMKDTIIRRPASPSLADAFERLKFLQDVLDESVGKEVGYE